MVSGFGKITMDCTLNCTLKGGLINLKKFIGFFFHLIHFFIWLSYIVIYVIISCFRISLGSISRKAGLKIDFWQDDMEIFMERKVFDWFDDMERIFS